jgi:hypothetical protein
MEKVIGEKVTIIEEVTLCKSIGLTCRHTKHVIDGCIYYGVGLYLIGVLHGTIIKRPAANVEDSINHFVNVKLLC